MVIVGLTGSIGMGKSTAASRFRERGIAVFDADAEVHRLYAGPLAAEIERAFPGTVVDGRVDRERLSAALVAAPQRFKDLELIVHPRVRAAERSFVQSAHSSGAQMVALELPLLFESSGNRAVDTTIVVSASADLQRRRVLERPTMTPEKLDAVLSRQIPDAEKRLMAEFVVDTGGTIDACNAQIDAIIAKLQRRSGSAFARYWAD